MPCFCHKLGKKAGAKLEELPKKEKKVEVLELDELCINKKNIWLWTAVDRATNRLVGFQIGTRETKYLQKLTDEISHIDAKFYASDHWHAYNLIDTTKNLTGKARTYIVERMNCLILQYLARDIRKTYCYSKNLQMIKYPLSGCAYIGNFINPSHTQTKASIFQLTR